MSWNPSQKRVPKGQAGGGRFGAGPPRNAAAAKAQQNKQAQQHMTQIMGMAGNRSQQGVMVKGLPDADLENLTAILYSFPSSDPQVVAARIAVANEMARRGIDIKKYGALGGGTTGSPRPTAVQRAVAVKRFGSARKAVKPPPVATPKPVVRTGGTMRAV